MPKISQTVKPTVKPTTRVAAMVDERIEKSAQLKTLKTAVEALDLKILAEAKRQGGSFESDEWKVTRVPGENRYISKEKLLELGVKPTVIAKATQTTEFEYPRITVKKNKGQAA